MSVIGHCDRLSTLFDVASLKDRPYRTPRRAAVDALRLIGVRAVVTSRERPEKGGPRMTRSLPMAVLLGAVCACTSPQESPSLDFTIIGSNEFPSPGMLPPPHESTVAVTSGPAGVTIPGILPLPDPCDDADARLGEEGGVLTLRIIGQTSRGHAQVCAGSRVVVHEHVATVQGLGPGRYPLRIVYDYRGGEGPPGSDAAGVVVWDDTVRVSAHGRWRPALPGVWV